MKAKHWAEFHDGARYERAAFRKYLRRAMADETRIDDRPANEAALAWVLKREKRYDARKGGL